MKINNLNSGQNLKGIESPASKEVDKNGKAKSGSEILSGDMSASKVNVSEQAQMMAKAKEIASQDSIDEAKVARLQKMIDEGSYRVDAGAIADRLVDEHLLMPE